MTNVDAAVKDLEDQLDPLDRVMRLFSGSLQQPVLVDEAGGHVFRYEHPDIRHFCLLKAVVALSALNASLALAKLGHIFEVCVLVRTVVECITHIEYVLDPNDDENHRADVEEYVAGYFADRDRDPGAEITRAAQVRQRRVHEVIGKTADRVMKEYGEVEDRKPGAQAYSSIYRAFSNFVHAKYPESIDLYGGRPGRFHVTGMSGTPKDGEMLATLAPIVGTTSNVIVQMIQCLRLKKLIDADPVITSWYEKRVNA